MSTRSSSRNLISPLPNPERLFRDSNRIRLHHIEEMDQNEQNPPVEPNHGAHPAPDLRTMEELCQPTMFGRGGPIAPVNIEAADFGLTHHMIQKVQNSCQFHGLPGEDANKHLDKFLTATQKHEAKWGLR